MPGTFLAGYYTAVKGNLKLGVNYVSGAIDKNKISYSENVMSRLYSVFQNYRAISAMKATIKDAAGNAVINYDPETGLRISKFTPGQAYYTFSGLGEGDYTFTAQTTTLVLDGTDHNAYDDSITLPLIIDNTAPRITSVKLNDATTSVTVTASDNRYLMALAASFTDTSGKTVSKRSAVDTETGGSATATLDISTAADPEAVTVSALDYAYNDDSGLISDFTNNVRVQLANKNITSTSSTVSLKFTNHLSSSITGKVLLGFYNSSGTLIKVVSKDKVFLPAADSSFTTDFTADGDLTAATDLKVFIWDGTSLMSPKNNETTIGLSS